MVSLSEKEKFWVPRLAVDRRRKYLSLWTLKRMRDVTGIRAYDVIWEKWLITCYSVLQHCLYEMNRRTRERWLRKIIQFVMLVES